MTDRTYIGEVLIKVWLKSIISELLHKQWNAQKESLKNIFRGSHKFPQAHEKVCDENESRIRKKKKGQAPKIFFEWKEGVYKACAENSSHGYQTTSGQRFFIHLFSK